MELSMAATHTLITEVDVGDCKLRKTADHPIYQANANVGTLRFAEPLGAGGSLLFSAFKFLSPAEWPVCVDGADSLPRGAAEVHQSMSVWCEGGANRLPHHPSAVRPPHTAYATSRHQKPAMLFIR
jgi:hypothetical protein